MQNNFDLKAIEALVIDMDGVLWEGNTALPGLNKFFDFLRDRAIPFMLATNNATKTPEQYLEKLAGMGVKVARETILTSSLATAAYLKREFPQGGRVYVVGQEGLREAVQGVGFTLAEDAQQPVEVVVAGLDMTLTYEKLKHATLLIRGGAAFVGTNADFTLPMERGTRWPGAGAILAAIQTATGVKPVTIGKPEPLMFEIAVQEMGSRLERTAMLGDRLDTDILGGQRAGLKTIFVTSGVDNEAAIEKKGVRPDVIFSGIDELVDVWQS